MALSEEIKKNKKGKLISKLIYLVFFITIVFGGYFFFSDSKKEEMVLKDIYTVGTGNLDIYISGEGKVISGNRLELNFPFSGEIKNIFKKEGELVSENEKIALLDDNTYKINLDKAKLSLKSAYAVLAEKKEITTTYKISQQKDLDVSSITLENTITKAKIDLDVAQNNYDLLKLKKENLDNTLLIEKDNLELIKQDENKKIYNLESILSLKANILLLDIEKYMGEIDELLGITDINKTKNDSFESYLGSKNINIKKEAESLFIDLYNTFDKTNLEDIEVYTSTLKDLLSLTISTLENSITSVSFTLDEINTEKLNFQSYLNSLEINYQSYIVAKQNLDYEQTNKVILLTKQNNLIKTLSGDIAVADKDLNFAKQNLENTKKLSSQSISLAETQKERSEAQYLENTSGLSDKELAPYYIAIEEAKNNVKNAEENLKDTILYSPVNGSILDINYKPGEYYTAGGKSFGVVISSDGQYIESYIEERDIINIYEGQNVNITLDALDGYVFTGSVIYVSSKGEEDENDIIVYKTLVSFDSTSDFIKDSMSSSIDFLSEHLEGEIIIPADYIYYEEGISLVTLENGFPQVIEEGLSDGEKVQILKGLKLGDKIVKK